MANAKNFCSARCAAGSMEQTIKMTDLITISSTPATNSGLDCVPLLWCNFNSCRSQLSARRLLPCLVLFRMLSKVFPSGTPCSMSAHNGCRGAAGRLVWLQVWLALVSRSQIGFASLTELAASGKKLCNVYRISACCKCAHFLLNWIARFARDAWQIVFASAVEDLKMEKNIHVFCKQFFHQKGMNAHWAIVKTKRIFFWFMQLTPNPCWAKIVGKVLSMFACLSLHSKRRQKNRHHFPRLVKSKWFTIS